MASVACCELVDQLLCASLHTTKIKPSKQSHTCGENYIGAIYYGYSPYPFIINRECDIIGWAVAVQYSDLIRLWRFSTVCPYRVAVVLREKVPASARAVVI